MHLALMESERQLPLHPGHSVRVGTARQSTRVGVVLILVGAVPLGSACAEDEDEPVLGTVWAPAQQGYSEVRPTTVDNGGDPTGLVEQIEWESWGGDRAVGTGISTVVRDPSAGVAGSSPEDVLIVAFDLGDCHGTRAYRAVAWYPPAQDSGGLPRDYIDICQGEYVTAEDG